VETSQKNARVAGLLYLIVVMCGIFSLAYAPNVIEEGKNGPELIAAIRSNETVFRLGIAAGLICYTAFLLLPLALYRLLEPYGRTTAIAMVALATASVPIAFSNMGHRIDILSVLADEPSLASLNAAQVQMHFHFKDFLGALVVAVWLAVVQITLDPANLRHIVDGGLFWLSDRIFRTIAGARLRFVASRSLCFNASVVR
jgi:hypothetical protein